MKYIIHVVFIILLSSVLWTCDKVDDPFPPDISVADSNIYWDDSSFSSSNNGERYVLMEEYTGHVCANCPGAAKEIQRIINNFYGEKFIPVSIHATESFAAPKPNYPNAPEGSFLTDHRADPESYDYEAESFFGATLGLPRGIVCRTATGLTQDKWRQAAEDIFNNPGETISNINITNFYDDSSKTYQVRIIIEWLVDYDLSWLATNSSSLYLSIFLTEDNVVDWQLDNESTPPYIENYIHRHMFREAINGSFGEELDLADAGEVTTLTYTRNFDPDQIGIDPENSNIIAFIYKSKPEWEVLQVNEAHLLP